ncbi:hypothetical protein CEXT_543271 [Caerostris extrusa]|uniref:Uncharacterized protein n=1 Tax=Caerostris extrusa TaxID=172846 RepID=A0AAV4PXL5_CAEEX|nr:hypothetical protein CEXT_543271 [Caerostris extrusa]
MNCFFLIASFFGLGNLGAAIQRSSQVTVKVSKNIRNPLNMSEQQNSSEFRSSQAGTSKQSSEFDAGVSNVQTLSSTAPRRSIRSRREPDRYTPAPGPSVERAPIKRGRPVSVLFLDSY